MDARKRYVANFKNIPFIWSEEKVLPLRSVIPLSADKENLTIVDWNAKLSNTPLLIFDCSLYFRAHMYSLDWVAKRFVFHRCGMCLLRQIPRPNPFPPSQSESNKVTWVTLPKFMLCSVA